MCNKSLSSHRDGSAGTDSGIDDLFGTLVNHAVVIRLEADADLETFGFCRFVCHVILSFP